LCARNNGDNIFAEFSVIRSATCSFIYLIITISVAEVSGICKKKKQQQRLLAKVTTFFTLESRMLMSVVLAAI